MDDGIEDTVGACLESLDFRLRASFDRYSHNSKLNSSNSLYSVSVRIVCRHPIVITGGWVSLNFQVSTSTF